jgi:hypothetical protein
MRRDLRVVVRRSLLQQVDEKGDATPETPDPFAGDDVVPIMMHVMWYLS